MCAKRDQTDLDRFVGDGVLGLIGVGVERNAGDLHRVVGHDEHGELELGDEFALLLVVDRIGLHEIVLGALDDAEASLLLVLEVAEREGHEAEALLGLAEEGARRLHLQLIDDVLLLVDGGACLALLGLAVAAAHQYVQRVHLVHQELALLAAVLSVRVRCR